MTHRPGSPGSKPLWVIQPGGQYLILVWTKRCDHTPGFQTFRTHPNPISSENINEAANFFSTSSSAPLLHTPSSPFNFSNLKDALPAIDHRGLYAPKSFPEMLHEPTQSSLSGAAWASDFMNFQQTQPNAPQQMMATPPSVSVQTAQRPTIQNPGLSSRGVPSSNS